MTLKFGTVPMLALSALAVAAVLPAAVQATEQFIPKGFTYAPGDDRLPPLNSPQDRVDAGADVRETEIWRDKQDKRIFLQQLDNFQNHDFNPPSDVYTHW